MKKLVFLILVLITQLSFAQEDESIATFAGDKMVLCVAFSPDGNTLVSGSTDNTLKLWDIASGLCMKTFTGHTRDIKSVAFSPDGKTCVSASGDKTLKLWDINNGQCLKTFTGHNNIIWSVAFSPDGKTFVSASWDKTIKLWDIANGQCIQTFTGHKNLVLSVAISPDGKKLASGSCDKTLKLWDITTGDCIKTITGHNNYVNSVAFSYNGKTLASGSRDRTLKLWDVVTGQCIKTFSGHNDYVNSVAFSPDGKTCVSASNDNNLKLWSIATGQCLKTFTGHSDFVYSVSFSPDAKTIASASTDKIIKLWDVSQYIKSPPTVSINNQTTDIVPAVNTPPAVVASTPNVSSIDINLPITNVVNDNTFVVIIANENYTEEVKVDYALNDGTIFKEYCEKTLGIPAENIHFAKNATYGKLITEKDWLANNLKAYKGDAKAIFYYAGHGIPGGQDQPAYLLPADGTSANVSSALKLDDLYTTITENPSKGVTVFLDACFSGSTRDAGMLASARGTKLKPRESTLPGNMVVFSAASGDETAWPYANKQHGMFTYYLLKKLQETKGDVSYKDLADYIADNVYKTAIKLNNKPQTPTTKTGTAVSGWESWKLK